MSSSNKIEFGDCRKIMRRWAVEGVKAQMCVTSPPYYGLRDYGHEGQLGLEQTPEEYIEAMVEVFRCVRDVLSDDGVLWLNIGDSYCGTGDKGNLTDPKYKDGRNGQAVSTTRKLVGYKQKDLIGIPWMLAFALRADGWYLRQDIVWSKPNAMPEPVRDRCTKSHEYIFLLTKSPRYFYDHEAMKEDAIGGNTRNRRSVWSVNTRGYKGAHFATFPPALIEPCILAGSLPVGAYEPEDLILSPAGDGERYADNSMIVGRAGFSRQRRDMEATRPISRSEQAAYAEQLRNSPYRQQMELEAGGKSTFAHYVRTDRNGARAIPPALFNEWISRGWILLVNIPPRIAKPYRSVILDPFMGSGTTAAVALQHGRRYLGCELNADYGALQQARISKARELSISQCLLPL
jgi:DNA modification methylase